MRIVLAAMLCLLGKAASGSDCSALKDQKLDHTTIASSESIAAGKFQPPYGNAIEKMPAFCRVTGVLSPSADSSIQFEVWLPEGGWNQKFLGVGNGGFAGAIDYRSMGGNVSRGYATAATNTGHDGDAEDASWAFHHPEKIVDFGYRAIHETAMTAKALVKAFYRQEPQHAYFDSCSDGGREALMEAQRFPEDYDGILAGAPAYDWTHLTTGGVDLAKRMTGMPEAYLSATKLPAINAAALSACDAADGVKDGIINDPAHCRFDPTVLRCKGLETRTCLTDPQIGTLKKLYEGSSPLGGFVAGSEGGSSNSWADWVIGHGPGGASGANYMQNFLRYMVFDDPALSLWKTSSADAYAAAEPKTAAALNATNTDLSKFNARGGKLLLYHGWNDPAVPPLGTIRYYDGVLAKMGRETAGKFVQLYMAPGMQHCFGGPGPSAFGQLGIPTAKGPKYGIFTALEQWAEQGTRPAEILSTKYANDNPGGKALMTRPLCPYPQKAVFKGGDSNEASSFACESTN